MIIFLIITYSNNRVLNKGCSSLHAIVHNKNIFVAHCRGYEEGQVTWDHEPEVYYAVSCIKGNLSYI